MEAANVFIFNSIEPLSVLATIGGEEFVVREASAGIVAKYRNHQMRATKFADGKMVGVDGAASSDPYLLSLCMWKGTDPVGLDKLLGWPERVVKPLIKWVKDNSGLSEQSITELKAEVAILEKKIAELEEKESIGKN